MSMSNVITLQLGHYANFVGTHFWNFQEESFVYDSKGEMTKEDSGSIDDPESINHDVLYREGLTSAKQRTYTPRLVSVDLKGSLGLLAQKGDLYFDTYQEVEEEDVYWDGEVEVIREDAKPKNEFQKDLENEAKGRANGNEKDKDERKTYNLDNQVEVWSDFLKARFHPKSMSIMKEYQHNSSCLPFDLFTLGQSSWRSFDRIGDDIEERVRFFAEEADHLKGFQLLHDPHSGFGGLSSQLSQLLHDEYPGKCVMAFPVIPSVFSEQSTLTAEKRLINVALSLQGIFESSSIISPMSLSSDIWDFSHQRAFPLVKYNSVLDYHTSAILASALDNITTSMRMKKPTASIWDLSLGLTPRQRKITSVSVDFPFALNEEQFLIDKLRVDDLNMVSLLPGTAYSEAEPFVQAACLRGFGSEYLKGSQSSSSSHDKYSKCNTISEAFQLYLDSRHAGCPSGISHSKTPTKIGPWYPNIFEESVTSDGLRSSNRTAREEQAVTSFPSFSLWQNSKSCGSIVSELESRARCINLAKLHAFTESGLEKDEWKETLENLRSLTENYQE